MAPHHGLLVAVSTAFLAASASLAEASNVTMGGRKLLTSAAPCPAGATCVANYAGTTFTSGSYYLAQAAANGAQYQWNTPSWWGGVCALQCTSMVNCKGIGGTCATTYSGNPNTPGVAGSVGCNYVMFGSNYCQGNTIAGGPGNAGSPALCTSGGSGTPLTVLCQCPAPSATQYTTSPCTGCQGSQCSGINTNVQCTAQCPAGSFTTDTCGLGTVLYQPTSNNFGGGGGPNGGGGGGGGNTNCPCANNARQVASGNCPCATTSPPPPSPSPPPPSPAYLRNQGNGNGNQVGHDTVCKACSTCGLGYTVSAPCVQGTSSTLGSDTQCSQCAAPPANAAFTAAGSCAWKCSDGYMPQGAGCVKSPIPSPPMPPPLAVLGPTNVPVSYFSNYQGLNVPNAPYTLAFSTGTVYNVGTQYLIGTMMTATENCNEFFVPVTGGAGPCPNGAMRQGQLTITCGAPTTSFSVTENPMCTYAMNYVTSQACPPGTTICPSPPPPKVYTSKAVVVKTQQAHNVFENGPNGPHKLNGGATSTSTETLANQLKNTVDTTSTTAVSQVGSGHGHVVKSAHTTDTTATMHPVTRTVHNSPPPPPPSPSPPPPTVYSSSHVPVGSTQLVVDSAPVAHVLNNGATTTSTDAVQHEVQHKYVDTTTTAASQQGTGTGNAASPITTTTDSTTTTNPVVNTIHNTFPSTTDMQSSTEVSWSSSSDLSGMWGVWTGSSSSDQLQQYSGTDSTSTASLKANGPLALLGPTNVPVSYFHNYQGLGMANAPYVVSFSTGTVYNVGTQYFIGNMMTATENCNEFTVPVTGGAGPCPNGAMRQGTLTITCGADQTSFSVDENPMCTYAMTYVTSQACPPGTQVCGAAQTAAITAAAVDAATAPSTAPATTTAASSSLCGGSPLQIKDVNKNLCLHVKGGTSTDGGFTLASLKRPIITMPCVADSPNQMFTASASAQGGTILHVASGLQLTTTQDVTNGAVVTLSATGNSPQELWQWQTPTVGGMLVSVANLQFEITDARVNAGASVGLPVHMWHLYKSLPSGAPKAQWAAQCSA